MSGSRLSLMKDPRVKALGLRVWRSAPHLLTVVAVVFLTQEVGRVTWRVIAGADRPLTSSVGNGGFDDANGRGKSSGEDAILGLNRLHLFGQAPPKKVAPPAPKAPPPPPPPPKISLENAPETTLPIQLLGLITPLGAFIRVPKLGEQLFRVNDPVFQNAVVTEILDDKVMLLHNGQPEKLSFPKQAIKGLVQQQGQLMTFKDLEVKSRRPAPGAAPAAAAAPAKPSGPPPELVQEVRRMALSEPEKLFTKMRVYPYSINGEFIGFKIKLGKDPKFLPKLGLQSGDIVSAVNGVQLTDPMQGLELLKDLPTAKSLNLEILRGRDLIYLDYDLSP